ANDRFATHCCALPHLADCRCIRVVLKDRRQIEPARQSITETKAIETRQVWRLHHRSIIDVHRSGNDNGYRRDFSIATVVNVFDNRFNYRAWIINLRCTLLEARVNPALAIDSRGTQVRTTEIGSEDQLRIRFIRSFHIFPTRSSVSPGSSPSQYSSP